MRKFFYTSLLLALIGNFVFLDAVQATSLVSDPDSMYVQLVRRKINNANRIIHMANQANSEKPRLLREYGSIMKRKRGHTLITVAKPLNANDQNIMRPFFNVVNPTNVAQQLNELTQLNLQLAAFLANEQVEFTRLLHEMNYQMAQEAWDLLNPQTAQDLVDDIGEAIEDLTSDFVDEVTDFLDDIF